MTAQEIEAVKAMVRRGQCVPAIFVRALLELLERGGARQSPGRRAAGGEAGVNAEDGEHG